MKSKKKIVRCILNNNIFLLIRNYTLIVLYFKNYYGYNDDHGDSIDHGDNDDHGDSDNHGDNDDHGDSANDYDDNAQFCICKHNRKEKVQ